MPKHNSHGNRSSGSTGNRSSGNKSSGNKSSGNTSGGSSSVRSILSGLAVGQNITQVALVGGFSLTNSKWAGFKNGNAGFTVSSGGAPFLVFIPLNQIVAIAV